MSELLSDFAHENGNSTSTAREWKVFAASKSDKYAVLAGKRLMNCQEIVQLLYTSE